MIPRRLRLNRRDFETVGYGAGLQRSQSPHFSVSYTNQPSGGGGCGVIVAKKVEKSSVGRHLLKRRIRAVLREVCSPDSVIVVSARPGAATLPFPELKSELLTLIEKLRTSGNV